MKSKILFITMLLFSAYSLKVKSQVGSLDVTFNPGTGASSLIYATAIQSDGKIIIGGDFTSYNGVSIKRIALLNVDGTLDLTFNPGSGADKVIRTIALQSDGKIIIGGNFSSYNGTTVNGIARLNPDGTLDATFNPGTGANGMIYTTAIQSDGKIIIGGFFTSYNGTSINRIARLNADGSLDPSFNPGTGANGIVYTTAIQWDGKIIIGGYFTSYNETERNFIARLNTDGTLDADFNPGVGPSAAVLKTTILSDGKIIIGGVFTSYNGIARNHIARLNADGTLDPAFNSESDAGSAVHTIAIQGDGKVIIGGFFTYYNLTPKNRIARLNTDGSLDATFVPGTGANGTIYTIAIQSDGKIIIVGTFTSFNETSRNCIARLNTDGTLDVSFKPGIGASSIIYATAIQSNGKIIIGGDFNYYDGIPRNCIARLNTDGTLDATFNPGTGADHVIHTTSIQGDGKIIIGGNFTSYNGTAKNYIARLNADGTLDPTFNTGTIVNGTVYSTAIQSDGKIIIGGAFSINGTIYSIARLNADGTLDPTFNPGSGANNTVHTIAIQNDGKVIIGGFFTSYNGTSINRIARLNADGTLDPTFNPGTGANNIIFSTAIQGDGKIIIGGYFTTYNGISKNRIARLNADGTLDPTFNPGTGANSIIYSTAVQGDGKIIIGGFFTSYNGTAINRIARLNADGTLDPTFNPGTGANVSIYTIAFQSDWKIIIGGDFSAYNGISRNKIARVLNCINTFSSLAVTACDSYTAPDGAVYTTSGTKTAVIPNAAGCDSTITIDLTIKNSTTSSLAVTACDSYTAPDGAVYTTSGTKTAVIPNAAGCDSTITIDLTINTIDVSLTVKDPLITANASGAIYQWLDCNNAYAIIPGATSQSFTPSVNGNYAVKITQGSCTDTSACVQIFKVGVDRLNFDEIAIYPNPVSNELVIAMKENQGKADFEILNSMGQVVFRGNLKEISVVKTSSFSSGVYLIKIKNGNSFQFKKIIKE